MINFTPVDKKQASGCLELGMGTENDCKPSFWGNRTTLKLDYSDSCKAL